MSGDTIAGSGVGARSIGRIGRVMVMALMDFTT